MAEIRRFYEELNKFWREEICHVIEALTKRRVDSRDFERWNSFRSSLNQTIKAWKVCFCLYYYAFPTDHILCPEPATKL
jgi:hypothetical protein